jgi:lactate/malate dehydrogenase, alpha/beta C-terminal domain
MLRTSHALCSTTKALRVSWKRTLLRLTASSRQHMVVPQFGRLLCELLTPALRVLQACPMAWVLIVTNPVNSTVPIARKIFQEKGCYDAARLFGVTTLDVCRANTFVAEKMEVPAENVSVPVVGGHAGGTILPLLSQASHDIVGKLDEAALAELTTRIQARRRFAACRASAHDARAHAQARVVIAHFTFASTVREQRSQHCDHLLTSEHTATMCLCSTQRRRAERRHGGRRREGGGRQRDAVDGVRGVPLFDRVHEGYERLRGRRAVRVRRGRLRGGVRLFRAAGQARQDGHYAQVWPWQAERFRAEGPRRNEGPARGGDQQGQGVEQAVGHWWQWLPVSIQCGRG